MIIKCKHLTEILKDMEDEVEKIATHEQLCDKALAHYLWMVSKLCEYDTTVPLAIAFYREHGGKVEESMKEKCERIML